jgi:hypothetical protein
MRCKKAAKGKYNLKVSVYRASAAEWYEYACAICNMASHNSRFDFSRYDKSCIPIMWRGIL